jgi:hypothetical protein
MKRNLVGVFVAALIACVLLAMAWKVSGANISGGIISTVNTARYALFGGSYAVQGGQEESGVFKIDSYTGETWLFKAEGGNGKATGKWVLIPGAAIVPAGE